MHPHPETIRVTRALVCFALLILAACQGVVDAEPRLDESRQEGISLTLSASTARISPGDTVRLTARLTNHTQLPVRLDFSSGCQILFYVENAEGKVVEPSGGGWGCTLALTSLQLAPGSYRAYATLSGTRGGKQILLRTTPETIELR